LFRKPFDGSIWFKTRNDLYFEDFHEDLKDEYVAAANAVRSGSCDAIGLDDSLELYVYPVIALLRVEDGRRRVRYTGVYNSTTKYPVRQLPPCAVICFACARVPHKWSEYRSVGGRVSIFGDVAVFSHDGYLPNTESTGAAPNDGNERRSPTIIDIDRRIRDLRNLRTGDFVASAAVYTKALVKYPDLQEAFNARFEALDQPFYDAARVCELTLPLRKPVRPESSSENLGPLLDAEQALKSFIDNEHRAVRELETLFQSAPKPEERSDGGACSYAAR